MMAVRNNVKSSETTTVDVRDSDKSKTYLDETDDQPWELVPPDGGWGWLVLAGSMLVNILVPGTVKSFGVLFVEFLEVFDASPAAAAWIPALCYFLYSSLGPLSSILSVKYSFRTVTVLGGTFAALGMIISFWASSVTYLYVSYGFLVGTGAGLSFPPTVYIVTSYFVRLRGLANGLCISGSAIGSIILPPLLRFLLETYGYRGAVLIMGAVTLNVWVGAIFYHPVELHMKRVPRKGLSNGDVFLPIVDMTTESEKQASIKNVTSIDESPPPTVTDKLLENNDKVDRDFVRSASSAAMQSHNRSVVSPVIERSRKVSAPVGKDGRVYVVLESHMHSTPALHTVPEAPNRSLDFFSQSRLPSRLVTAKAYHRSPSTSSFHYISTPYHGSTLSTLHPQEVASSLTLKSLSFNPVATCCKAPAEKETKKTNRFFDVSLLKDPMYLVILISNSTNAISYTNFIILLPSYAILLNYGKSMSAYLISIVSALDLVGRIGGSALSDLGLIPKQWYFIGGLLVSGIALTLLPIADNYTLLCVFCGIFGLASGVYVGVTAVIMADMLGTERLTSTYGISLFVNGILQLIGPPLCGLWFERAGSYVPLFTTLGIVLIFGAGVWGFVPFIKRKQNKNVEFEVGSEKCPLRERR